MTDEHCCDSYCLRISELFCWAVRLSVIWARRRDSWEVNCRKCAAPFLDYELPFCNLSSDLFNTSYYGSNDDLGTVHV